MDRPRRHRVVRAAAASVLLVAAVAAPSRALAPVGGEFQAHTFTSGDQDLPAAATDRDGDFVVVWSSSGQDGGEEGIFARRFASTGAALGAEIQVNQFTTGAQTSPAVAMDADGDFVVVWQSALQDGSENGVFARRFASSGAAVGGELQVNTYTPSYQRAAVVAMDATGDFVVAWTSERDGSGFGVFARRFASTGAPAGGEFQVSTYTYNYQGNPEIGMEDNGDFVVAWESYQDGASYGVFARRFASTGAALGPELQVNTFTTDLQAGAVVAMDADGDFVVAWQSYLQDGSDYGVFARRHASTGAALGSEIRVNVRTGSIQSDPAISIDGDGDFLVTWTSDAQDGDGYGVFARRFTSSGAAVAGEFQVNARTVSYQSDPIAAMLRTGDFVVAWASDGQDGAGYGVFGRRWLGRVLDVDGNGILDALTDGVLVLRWSFGLSGASLVNGAVDLARCTRCDASSIEPRLTSIAPHLDADADGERAPLTDGLLVVRSLFGLTGNSLTSGAVDLSDCTRCTAQAIQSHFASLL
jgi:hypothetical protein